jgi:hypothetical protein
MRVQRVARGAGFQVADGESTIAEARQSPTDVAPTSQVGTATEVRTAAKMPTAMAATTEMRTTMTSAMTSAMTAAVTPAMTAVTTTVTTAAMATTTFRSGKPSGRQHCRESNDGNAEIQF